MVKYVKTYVCSTCGSPASGRGHLCHPFEGNLPYKCEFCKKRVNDPRHVCSSMIDKIEYICKDCGRLAPYSSLLCEPALIDED
jgi:DNA-directed RNA polymerase subunit RPC12/RpoP